MIPNFNFRIVERSRVGHFYKDDITHIVSISCSDTPFLSFGHFIQKPNILFCSFDDVLEEGGEADGWKPPTEYDIWGIIYFAREIKRELDKPNIVRLVCHCAAGVSRSTAAAYIILNVLVGAGHEKHCFQEVLRVRSCALPNPLMCKIADKLLDRGGNLVKLANDYRDKFLIDDFKKYYE